MFLDVSCEDLGEIGQFLFQPTYDNMSLIIHPSLHAMVLNKSKLCNFKIFASSTANHDIHLYKS